MCGTIKISFRIISLTDGKWQNGSSCVFSCLTEGHPGKACQRSSQWGQHGCLELHHWLLQTQGKRQSRESRTKLGVLSRNDNKNHLNALQFRFPEQIISIMEGNHHCMEGNRKHGGNSRCMETNCCMSSNRCKEGNDCCTNGKDCCTEGKDSCMEGKDHSTEGKESQCRQKIIRIVAIFKHNGVEHVLYRSCKRTSIWLGSLIC